MSLNTWTMTLTVRIDKTAVLSMRDFLRQRSILVPMRDKDVVAKYLHRVLENGNARNAIDVTSSLRCPLATPPIGFEGNPRFNAAVSSRLRERLYGLAVDSFAALIGLACIALIAASAFTHSPHIPAPWYDTSHANTVTFNSTPDVHRE
jgi:hypothetical protein